MPKREDINTRRNLILRKEGYSKYECAYNIVQSNAKYDVILFESNNKNYKGTGVQTYFEDFATQIKNDKLNNIHDRDINWYQWIEWKINSFEDKLVPVKMSFDGQNYSDPQWGTEVKLEE